MGSSLEGGGVEVAGRNGKERERENVRNLEPIERGRISGNVI